MGSYIVDVYVVGAAFEYCLKDWELVMQAYISHGHVSLIGMRLPQACIYYRHISLTGLHLSQTYISHRHVSFIGVRLSQICISHSMHLP
jgi:hypothetical protein